ncbi:MAG: hypothetical protein PHC53_01170 [Patescibacteria group bacterium]|nr:hypothetical protein [Patescibacteria group bacterium]
MNLLTFDFWFQMQPSMFLPWIGTTLLVIFIALAIMGLVAKLYGIKANLDKFNRRAVERVGTLLLTMGLLGLLFYLFVFESVPILSMRVWLIVLLLSGLAWAWSILRYIRVEIPRINQLKAEREKLNKWLPKSKK